MDQSQSERARQQANIETSVPAPATQDPATAEPEPAVVDEPAPEVPKPIHRGVHCDICGKTIEGVRHKCLDCPDYDLCTSCITQARINGRATIQPGEVRVHPTGTPAAQPSEPSAVGPVVHHATCDLCESSIVDKRFKCLQCPDWDVCEQCFSIVDEQHPGHGFVCVTDPLALRQYQRVRCAPRPYHHARCDECDTNIIGVRYKCMHPACSDYDLCAKCEALPIPVHPSSHPMLKIR
ncbi:hypothetical protein K488DRAFT_46854, partial [Vararia minispora EC-137]